MLSRLALASVLLLAFPSAGHAAVAGWGLTGPAYVADAKEANSLTVGIVDSGKYEFRDPAVGVVLGYGCTWAAGGADCSKTDAAEALIYLEDRDDNFTSYLFGAVAVHVDGGTGNDHLVGGPAADMLSGGPGNDITDGGAGNDVLDDSFAALGTSDPGSGDDTMQGGDGDDTLVAGAGADTIDGGPGFDTVDYSAATAPVTVTVDAGSHDDGASEGDTVSNVERVLGGSGPDTLVAGAASSRLVGAAGDDVLRGGAGSDTLLGDDEAGSAGSGNDVLDGGAGADVLRGGDGIDTATYASRATPVHVSLDDVANDVDGDNVRSDVENVVGGSGDDTLAGSATANVLTGGPGNDRLDGAGGADTLDGGPGDDTLQAADGAADAISCGAGDDTVVADALDVVAADCEHVTRPPAPAPVTRIVDAGGAATPPPPAAPQPILAGGSLKVDKRGRVRVTFACPAACTGRVTLSAGTTTLASAPFNLAAGTIHAVSLKLSKASAKRVRRAHRLPAKLTATGATGVRVALSY